MVKLVIKVKPNTNGLWLAGEIANRVGRTDNFIFRMTERDTAVFWVKKEDEVAVSRTIRLISPQVVSVERA